MTVSNLDKGRVRQLHQLERVLGVRFRKLALLHQSLIHSSYRQSQKDDFPSGDNETLEFLGDSVIGLVVAEQLYRLYPDSEVGELAKVKSQVVSRVTLGEIALKINLDRWILVGQGEASRGESKRPSVIGSALEAVLGAIFLDRGLEPAAKLIRRLLREQITEVEAGTTSTDYKSLLQEYVLRYFKASPSYHLVAESGPGHGRKFIVSVGWSGKVYGQGSGPSKKVASQEAAKAALEHLLAPLS